MVTIEEPSPDLLGIACLFFVFGLLVQAKTQGVAGRGMLLVGLALGAGYLARSAYFPLSLLCLAVMVVIFRDRRILLALAAFALTAAPFICAISISKGRFTYGEAGTLNYAWQVNGAARSYHWQGEGFRTGTPVHPTRRVMESPEVFEFAAPVAGTYPPWYDPSYWYEGLTAHFSLPLQLAVFYRYLKYLLLLVILTPGLLIAVPRILSSKPLLSSAARTWWILLIPIAGSLMFCLVVVDKRHVAAFLAVIGIVLFGLVYRDPKIRRIALAMAYLSTFAFVAVYTGRGVFASISVPLLENPSWEISENAKALGLRAGDKIAYIGCGINAYWARLSRVQIVADINYRYLLTEDIAGSLKEDNSELRKFWSADRQMQEQVFAAFSNAGATFVAADQVPAGARLDGWTPVGRRTYLRKLAQDSTPLRPVSR